MKIAIFEDDDYAVAEKYQSLSGHHDLMLFIKTSNKKWTRELLDGFNFQYASLSTKLPLNGKNMPQADLYFLDGLEGDCFRILQHLPRAMSYIYTGSNGVISRAKKEGANLVFNSGDLQRIIEEHTPVKNFLSPNPGE